MITWGISANSHDAALSVFCDEKLAFASHSERFSRIKNDPNLNQRLVDYARDRWGEPNQVFWYERPMIKSFRQLFAGQGLTFKENNIKQYLSRYGVNCTIKYTDHHLSHAAAGYYTSPFDDACVIVMDAIGEFTTLSIWYASKNKLKRIYHIDFPHSIGLWYSAMTQRIGLTPNEDEYILMGMAAYGDSQRLYKDIIKDFLIFPDYNDSGELLYFRENLHKGCRDWRTDLTSEQDMFDIAAATQAVYEKIFRETLEYAQRFISSKNLVFMGGCALNCAANSLAYNFFDNVYIMPNPGDAGSAIGTVLAHNPDWRTYHTFNPFLGYDMGYHNPNEKIVDYLVQNKVCGLARGRAEFGPRALGNRSLIADPRDPNIKSLVNDIKQRQQFRPFAPAVLEEFADQYFDMPTASTPYMQFTAKCLFPDKFPAITHKDGTSRVQTVNKTDNPEFRDLLEKWFVRTGCPMLLNTSLNIKGEPMINDHKDADRWSQKYGLPVFN